MSVLVKSPSKGLGLCSRTVLRRIRRELLARTSRTESTRCPVSGSGAPSSPGVPRHRTPGPSGPGPVSARTTPPPGPKSLPFIGTMYKYLPYVGTYDMKDRQTADTRRYEAYGPVVREEVFPGQVVYYIYDPKLFPQVFSQEPKFPFRFEMSGVKEYRESRGHHPGFPNAKGEDWYKIRQPTNRLTMNPGSVRAYLEPQQIVVRDMVGLMRARRDTAGEVLGIMDIFYRWAMESIGVVIFDTRLGTLSPDLEAGSEAHSFVEAANTAFDTMYDTTFFWPLHKNKRTKTWKRLCQGFDYIVELSEKQVEASLERSRRGDTDDGNFLQALSLSPGLAKSEILSIVCDLFYGGVDTVCHNLAFTLYHVSKHPEVQRTLRTEISQHAAQGRATPASLDSMKYIKAVVKETNRLTPVSAFGVARTFDKDIVVDGYTLEAGSMVLLQPNVAAVSEEYFQEPRAFRPERWLRDNNNGASASAFPMMSFGAGSRMCPGKRFAEQEMFLALIHILHNFDLSYDHEDIKMTTRFSNQPDRPLQISFTDREQS